MEIYNSYLPMTKGDNDLFVKKKMSAFSKDGFFNIGWSNKYVKLDILY